MTILHDRSYDYISRLRLSLIPSLFIRTFIRTHSVHLS
jgi:hypothetical protein